MNSKNQEIHPSKIKNILKLNPYDRYLYFLRKVTDFELLFILENEFDENGKLLILLWPEIEFSQLWLNSKNKDSIKVKKISINDFLENILNKLNDKNVQITIFPTETDKGYNCKITDLKKDLVNENSQYE
jgi:hypothetical protein